MPGCPPPAVWSRGGLSSQVLGPVRTGGTRLLGPRGQAGGPMDPCPPRVSPTPRPHHGSRPHWDQKVKSFPPPSPSGQPWERQAFSLQRALSPPSASGPGPRHEEGV